MKKKVLMSSIVTIVLCLTLIAGSTFALFTDKNEINIAVTSGKVDMTAKLDGLTAYSVRPATVAEQVAAERGELTLIEDEFNGLYVYEEKTNGVFANGGTATLNDKGNTLELNLVTPGDKVAFDIVGTNESDVTTQYRYIIECVGGQTLMSGLLVTINGVTYDYLGSYTSPWMTLEPTDKVIDNVPVVIELPVKAGNDYQMQKTAIKVTVEAVQGNADVADNSVPLVEYLNGVTVEMGDKPVSKVGVVNTSNLDLNNGTIEVDYVGFQNYGEATLTNVEIKGGTSGTVAYGYALNAYAGSNTVLNNVIVDSNNGGVSVSDGGQLTFNSGSVEVDSKSTSGRYLFYVVGEDTVATINGGNFDFNKTQNQKRAYAYVGEGATLIINGGTFGTASSRSGYTAGLLGEGDIIITGGTFGFNPTTWVANGCKVEKIGKNWVVSSDNATLNEAIQNGDKEITLGAGSFTMPATTGDVTITGNENTVITINKPTANNVTIKGVTVVGSGNYTGIQHSDKVVYENCVIKGVQFLYANEVEFINCVIDLTAKADYIWTYGAKNVTFDGCTFNTAGKALLIYSEDKGLETVVTVKNCTFNATASALASGATAAAIEIDSSLSTNGHYTLITENNTVDSDFSGEWRIKKSGTDNTTVNGVIYNAITIDGVQQ